MMRLAMPPLLLLLLLLLAAANAADVGRTHETPPSPEDGGGTADELPAHADVHVEHVFPNRPSTRLQAVLGESVQLLVLVSSAASEPLNVSHVACTLHSPLDHTFLVQNFPSKRLGAVVTRDADVSLDYMFRPDAALHPIQYGLEARLWYTVDDVAYASTFFNGTIELSEAPFEWSASSVAPYALLAALLAVGAALLAARKAQGGRSDAAPHRSSRGHQQQAARGSSDWIDAAILTRPAASGARSASSRRKAAKKH